MQNIAADWKFSETVSDEKPQEYHGLLRCLTASHARMPHIQQPTPEAGSLSQYHLHNDFHVLSKWCALSWGTYSQAKWSIMNESRHSLWRLRHRCVMPSPLIPTHQTFSVVSCYKDRRFKQWNHWISICMYPTCHICSGILNYTCNIRLHADLRTMCWFSTDCYLLNFSSAIVAVNMYCSTTSLSDTDTLSTGVRDTKHSHRHALWLERILHQP